MSRPSITSAGLRAVLVGAVLASAGCSYAARDTASYRSDTSALLDTRANEVEACYAAELERNPSLVVGKLTLTFTVAKKSGKLIPPSWDRNRTTVSESLATCVVTALIGLELTEPDLRDGEATFVYQFRGSPPK